MILSFGGKTPRDEGAVFVAANATVLGDVTLGKGTNIWYGAVLRGDEGTLVLGENCNVQDNAVLHCDPGGHAHGHRVVGDDHPLRHQRSRPDDAVFAHDRVVEQGGVHPDEAVFPHCAAVGKGAVAHRDVLAQKNLSARVIKTIRDDQLAHNIENAEAYVEMGRQHAALVSDAEN